MGATGDGGERKAMEEIGGDAVDRKVRAWEARERALARERAGPEVPVAEAVREEGSGRGTGLAGRVATIAVVIMLAGTAAEVGPEHPVVGWLAIAAAIWVGSGWWPEDRRRREGAGAEEG